MNGEGEAEESNNGGWVTGCFCCRGMERGEKEGMEKAYLYDSFSAHKFSSPKGFCAFVPHNMV